MNCLRGLGVVAVLAGIVYATTVVASIERLVLGISIAIVAISLVTWAASVRRRRRDHLLALGGRRGRRLARAERVPR